MSRVPTAVPGKVLAILAADLHLSIKAPVARSCEPNWLAAMERQLEQLRNLKEQYQCPVIVAGDIFHSWASPSELVNFAIANLPKVYTVAGQHDLSHHCLRDIRKTSYWTLVEAGVITNLEPNQPIAVDGIRMHGFPWSVPIRPLTKPHDLVLEVAVVHRYVWLPGKSYPNAPQESRLRNCGKQFQGYDVVVIGDNHHPWMAKMGKTNIINVGGFYRRHADEIAHRLSVGLLHADGSVTRHYLDVSEDQFLSEEELRGLHVHGMGDTSGFVEAVGNLQDAVVDFEQEVRQHVERDKIKPLVKKIILQSLEKDKNR